MKRRAVLVLLLVLTACSGPKTAEVQVPVAAPVPHPPAVQAAPSAVPARVFDESLLRGREFLLEMERPSPRLRDPVVGPWNKDAVVSQAIETLVRGADRGTLDSNTLVSRWADYLQGWVRRVQQQGMEGTVRVGEARESTDGLMVPARVFGAEQEWTGWVFLVREGNSLLVSDVQMEPSTRSPPPDPESPDQPISSPSRR